MNTMNLLIASTLLYNHIFLQVGCGIFTFDQNSLESRDHEEKSEKINVKEEKASIRNLELTSSSIDTKSQQNLEKFINTFKSKNPKVSSGKIARIGGGMEHSGSSKQVDVIFLIDCSSSLGREIFHCGLEALQHLTEIIDKQNPVNYEGTRISAIKFSTGYNLEFGLRSYKDLRSIIDALGDIKYTGGVTHTSHALRAARNHFNWYGRKNSEKVVMLLTDGKSTLLNPQHEARRLRDSGVEIFAVPVSNQVDFDEIRNVVSYPQSQHIIKSLHYCQFKNAIEEMYHKYSNTNQYSNNERSDQYSNV